MTFEDYVNDVQMIHYGRNRKCAEIEARNTIEHYLKPFQDVIDRFVPNNQTTKEFRNLLEKMGHIEKFNGKAIYNPSGKACEYSHWACNFYVGCSNMCEYCYCKKGILNNVMGMDKPQLKKCFKDETEALECFKKELTQNVSEIRKHGLFFSFTTDPMLEETHKLTWEAACFAMENNVPVKILTKCVGKWVDQLCTQVHSSWKKFLAIGFTLTGHDELEGNSATSMDRIRAMVDLHKAGYKTFASIEPVVDFVSAYSMINLSRGACDLYKIGLMSGKRYNAQEKGDAECFLEMIKQHDRSRFYLKDTLITLLKLDRDNLPGNFVRRDYNLFSDYEVCTEK